MKGTRIGLDGELLAVDPTSSEASVEIPLRPLIQAGTSTSGIP